MSDELENNFNNLKHDDSLKKGIIKAIKDFKESRYIKNIKTFIFFNNIIKLWTALCCCLYTQIYLT